MKQGFVSTVKTYGSSRVVQALVNRRLRIAETAMASRLLVAIQPACTASVQNDPATPGGQLPIEDCLTYVTSPDRRLQPTAGLAREVGGSWSCWVGPQTRKTWRARHPSPWGSGSGHPSAQPYSSPPAPEPGSGTRLCSLNSAKPHPTPTDARRKNQPG